MSFLIVIATAAEEIPSSSIARSLADPSSRSEAIETVIASPAAYMPTLILWTKQPPPNVNLRELYLSMMEIFGRLRVREGVPFLVGRINFRPFQEGNIWKKQPEVILRKSPAIRALVQIQHGAIPQLEKSYINSSGEDRMAIVFTLAMMRDPEARSALRYINDVSSFEATYSSFGLKWLDEKK